MVSWAGSIPLFRKCAKGMQEDIKCIEGGRGMAIPDGLLRVLSRFRRIGHSLFPAVPFSDNLLKVPVGKLTVQPEDDAVVRCVPFKL